MKRMKKLAAALTAAILTAAFPSAAFADAIRLGDVDEDGVVDRADAVLLGQYLAGNAELDDAALQNADMNGDGEISEDDLTLLSEYEQDLCITQATTGTVTSVQDPEDYSPWITDPEGNTYPRGTNASLSTTLEIVQYPQTSFLCGETFSTNGLKVHMINQRTYTTLTYDVSDNLVIYTDYDANTAGTYTVKVYTDYTRYEAKTDDCVTYQVTVAAATALPSEDGTTGTTTGTTVPVFTTETTTVSATEGGEPSGTTCTTTAIPWETAELPQVTATTVCFDALVGHEITLVMQDPTEDAESRVTVAELQCSDEKILTLGAIEYLGDVISIHTEIPDAGYAYVLAKLSNGDTYLFLITAAPADPSGETGGTGSTTEASNPTGTHPMTSTAAPESAVPGDVDGNGTVALSDAIMLAKAVAGDEGTQMTIGQRLNADLDGDGSLTGADLMCLLKYLSGSLNTL